MKKKFIDSVYMKEVTEKVFYVEKNKDIDGYIGLKYIKETSKPISYYCNGSKYVCLDKDFTILEYVPIGRNYNCRIFFDKDNQPLEFYFDINDGVGIENNVPWYNDMYLDVIVECPKITGGFYYIRLDDEKEFIQAKRDGILSDKQFKEGYRVANSLMSELKNQTNDIFKRCMFDLFRLKEKLKLK